MTDNNPRESHSRVRQDPMFAPRYMEIATFMLLLREPIHQRWVGSRRERVWP